MVSSLDLKALNVFNKSPVSQDMIHKLVVATLQVIPVKDSKTFTMSPKNSSGKERPLPSLMTFLTRLVRYTNVYTGTLMATLVYLNKLKARLPKQAQGLPCTRHRILLSCLILSAKYHNDSSPKNIHWAKYTDGLFTVRDINLMERQLLHLLNWDLTVSNEDMAEHLSEFLDPIKEDIIQSRKMRKFLQMQKQQKMMEYQMHSQKIPQSSSPSACTDTYTNASLSPSSTISRTSSNTSIAMSHYRQDSSSSVSSLESFSSTMNKPASFTINKIDPAIELAALKEEIELNKMIQQFKTNSSACYQYA